MSTGRENWEHAQGIERVNEMQIKELEQQLADLNSKVQTELERRKESISKLLLKRQTVTDGIQKVEREIEGVQFGLDDFVSSSVWPDYIPRDPKEAYDPDAAEVHQQMLDDYSFEDAQHITRGMDTLKRLYDEKAKLATEAQRLNDPELERTVLHFSDNALKALRERRSSVTTKLEEAKSNRSLYSTISKSAMDEIETAEKQERTIVRQDEAVAASKDKLEATQKWLDRKKQVPAGKRIELRKSIVQNMTKPRDRAAAKLNAMGSGLFEEVLKLQTPWKHEAAAHAKEMLALRAGVAMKPRNRILRVEVIDRGDPKGNACTCYLLDYDVIAVITIEEDRQQHDKLVYSTCLVEDDLWTEAENNTEGVPPNLSQLVHKRPKDLELYVRYHHMIRSNIDESRAASD